MTSIAKTVQRLCQTSTEQRFDPRDRIEWPDELQHDGHWFTSPEFISLNGTEVFTGLSEKQQQHLSFWEAINFYSLNIHGERMLVAGLSARLYREGTSEISPYLHHFLDEENKHMYYFGEFCRRYAGFVFPEKKFSMESDFADGEEDFMFFAKVLVFEELVDVLNREMGRDKRLHPLARQINQLHHFEETRHLAFGRDLVRQLFSDFWPKWSDDVRTRISETIGAFFSTTWSEYYNPEAYRRAGLKDVYALRREAMATDAQKAHRKRVSRSCCDYFCELGVLAQEVEL